MGLAFFEFRAFAWMDGFLATQSVSSDVSLSSPSRLRLVLTHISFNRDPEEIAPFDFIFRGNLQAISGGERRIASRRQLVGHRSASEIASTSREHGRVFSAISSASRLNERIICE
jgi:hypothetical protein